MNTAVNANVVHESEAQRQHARVKIPAKLAAKNTFQKAIQDASK